MKFRGMVVAATLGSAVMSAPNIASAEKYFSIFGGYTDADNLDFQVAPGTVSSEFDSGYGFGLAVGKRLGDPGASNRWRLEGELAYRSNDIKSHKLDGADLEGAFGEITSRSLMVNALIDFNAQSSFSPYIGAGLGFADVSADGFGVSAIQDVLDDGETVLAYQLIAGAGYDVSPNTELFLEYRYFATDDPSVTTSVATGAVETDLSYKTNNVFLGARFNF